MAYKVYLNRTNLIFDSSLQDESFLFTRAIVYVEAGSAGSFDFVMAPSHEYYDQLHQLTDYIDVYRDTELIFSGRIYSITTQFDLQKAVSCEGLLAVLADSIYRPVTFQGNLVGLVEDIINEHNSQVEGRKQILIGDITVENSGVYREYQNYETSISRLQDLAATFGGHMMLRKSYTDLSPSIVDVDIVDIGVVDISSEVVLQFDWLDEFTTACTQAIELTSNLITLKKTQASDDIVTVLIPLGAQDEEGIRLTIESVNSGRDYIVASAEAIAEHGLIVKSVIWDDVTLPSNLLRKAQDYLTAALTPKVEIQLTAVDLADAGEDIDSFRVGQKISVTSIPHGLDAVLFSCVEQTLDLLQPAQNTILLGELKLGYVQSQRTNVDPAVLDEIANQRTITRQLIKTATELITGNSGGYVVLHDSDGDGQPDEILVMDTPEIDTAVKIWRWNNSGLGYSSTGYNGTFGLAMTIDGRIVADFIAAGTMLADRIRGGTLSLGGINNEAGQLIVYDANNNEIGRWDKDGASISGDVIMSKNKIYAQIGSQYTDFPGLLYSGTWALRDGFHLRFYNNNNVLTTRRSWVDVTGSAGDVSVTNGEEYVSTVIVSTDTDIDTSTTPSTGVKVQTASSTRSTSTSGLIAWWKVFARNLANVSQRMTIEMGYQYFYVGDSFPANELSYVSNNLQLYMNPSLGFIIQAGTRAGASMKITASSQLISDRQVAFSGSSSKRYKHSIQKLTNENLDPHKLLNLPVKEFVFNDGKTLQYADMKDQILPGFIAEDVAEIYPSAVIHNYDGEIENWDERRIIPGMLALIQEQHTEIQQLKAELTEIKALLKEALNGTK